MVRRCNRLSVSAVQRASEVMFDDLVEDEFANRPDDDELAFLHFEKLFRKPLDEALASLQAPDKDQYWDSYNHFMQTYINHVLATVKH